MPRIRHKGPLVFGAFFALASIGMTVFGTLPTHLALTAKILMLIYAVLLCLLAFAPVKGERPREAQEGQARGMAGASRARA